MLYFYNKLICSTALPHKGLTLLHLAAFYDSTECLLELINFKMPIDINSVDEYHPLHYASLFNSLESASILLSLGSDPNYTPNDITFLNLFNFKINFF